MPSRIKVLHVVFSLDAGGMENGIVNLSHYLDAGSFETHAFCLERAGRFGERLANPDNIHVHGKNAGFSPGAVWGLHRHIRSLNPDIVHTHNLGPLIYGGLASLGGRFKPLVHGEHSQLTEEERTPKRMRQRRWLYRTCARIHTVSNSLKRELVDLGFCASKLEAIPNGVDTERFSPCHGIREAMREGMGLPRAALVIGIVGRFGPYKRHAVLIDAFSRLAARLPDLHLLIVGTGGPLALPVRAQAEASAFSGRIRLPGFQDRTEDYYRATDLLVAPSINEGLSNAVLEAMACGVPVLSHHACGSSEAITHGHDGYILDLRDAESLEAQLAAILATYRTLPEMGRRAREKMVRDFSLAAMAQKYAALYRSTLFRSRDRETRSDVINRLIA